MYRIGIDLGGTNIAAGVVDEGQHIVAEVSLPTGAERPAEAVVADICRAAEKAMEKAGITAANNHLTTRNYGNEYSRRRKMDRGDREADF